MADPADAPPSGSIPHGGPPASAARAPASAARAPEALKKSPRLDREALEDFQDLPAAVQASVTDADLEKMLAWAREFDGTPEPAAGKQASTEADQDREQQSRRRHKFRKFDPAAADTGHSATEMEENAPAGETVLEGDGDEDLEGDTAPRSGRERYGKDPRRALVRPKLPRPSLLSSLIVQFLILIFLAAGFLLGRATFPSKGVVVAKRPVGGDKEPAPPSASEMNLVNQAIAAKNGGDVKKASALLDQLRHTKGHVAGLDYQLAALAFQGQDAASALMLVNRSIAQNEALGESYALRGLIMNNRGMFKGLHDFQAGAQADPFGAKSFFFWGEALRRGGRLQEALVHLREAVARAQNPWDQAMYELKVRLTQIELGQGRDLAAALEAQMASPSPPVAWLLTAVGQELHDGDFPAAAHNLERTRPLLGAALMAGTLRDYFFMAYADKPALAPVYAEILGRPEPVPSPMIQVPLPPPTPPAPPAPPSPAR